MWRGREEGGTWRHGEACCSFVLSAPWVPEAWLGDRAAPGGLHQSYSLTTRPDLSPQEAWGPAQHPCCVSEDTGPTEEGAKLFTNWPEDPGGGQEADRRPASSAAGLVLGEGHPAVSRGRPPSAQGSGCRRGPGPSQWTGRPQQGLGPVSGGPSGAPDLGPFIPSPLYHLPGVP